MTGIVEWLEQQIAADEATARKARGGPWTVDQQDRRVDEPRIESADGKMTIYAEGGHRMDDAEHIIRWDPARVLAECAAKRAILDEHADIGGSCVCCTDKYEWNLKTPCPTVSALALPYAGQPGFQDEWKL